MKECAAKGRGPPCTGPATIRCGLCGAVNYCSIFHQKVHWSEHREECKRMEEQMSRISVLHDFPFTFTQETTELVEMGKATRCAFLERWGLHQVGLWKSECSCCHSLLSIDAPRTHHGWNLPSAMCPCTDPQTPLSSVLSSWADYYNWRCLPLDSPVALLLHWPLTLYYSLQLVANRLQNITPRPDQELRIHYLGPEKELQQLPVFGELSAIFPRFRVHIDFVGPVVPHFRDGECIKLNGYAQCLDGNCQCKFSRHGENRVECESDSQCKKQPSTVLLRLWKGLYHERFQDIIKVSSPHFIMAPNAGIAAYSSWLPTIKLLSETHVPAVFSDYCEEAAFLAARCISSIHASPLALPVDINPFRQPMLSDDGILNLPTYSNSFLFGM